MTTSTVETCPNCQGTRVWFNMGMKEQCSRCDGIGYIMPAVIVTDGTESEEQIVTHITHSIPTLNDGMSCSLKTLLDEAKPARKAGRPRKVK